MESIEPTPKRPSRVLAAAVAVATFAMFLSAAAPSTASGPDVRSSPAATAAPHLNLGAPDLPETRTVTTLAPGVTRTSITRGGPDGSLFWTAEVAIPSDSPDPDAPSSALSSQADAQKVAEKLRAAGVDARVEQVISPQLADAGGSLGYRVRAGHVGAKADGTALAAQIKTAGYASSIIYTGWDGDVGSSSNDRGPWHLQVITIDPKQYRGELSASFGPDLQRRETTSQLAAAGNAVAAINGGFFVFDPKAGAEGDPAGVGVYGGRTLSEPVGDRPALVLDGPRNRTSIERLAWHGTVSAKGGGLALDGIDRVPGLIRNCGSTGDVPTVRPLQDFTCTNPSQLIEFSPEFGATTPSGPGLEVVLDGADRVAAVNASRGTTVPAGGHTLQATGDDVGRLRALAPVGSKLKLDAGLVGQDGKTVHPGKATSIVNGGPMLVKDGLENVTAKQDGMVHPDDNNSFYYGWVHKRNPRTFAGVDAQGRTLLVTADGRQTSSLGLSIKETADVARSLGMVQAMNLDGGGSTTMVSGGAVVNSPSDGTERAVGDAVLVLPGR